MAFAKSSASGRQASHGLIRSHGGRAVYRNVAKARKAALVPFLLKGVADTADPTRLFQADRIHPKEEAHPMILDNVWPALRKLLLLPAR